MSAWYACQLPCEDSHLTHELVLQETIALESKKQPGQSRSFVVNNLEQDERFKLLPFVQGAPHFRFYAGTPLTTENGVDIGCLFVLDPTPRDGLSDVESKSLGTTASLVMDFLRVSRQASEGRRTSRLARGLTYFVNGSSSFIRNFPPSSETNLRSYSSSSYNSRTRSRSGRSKKSSIVNVSDRSSSGDALSSRIIPSESISVNSSDHPSAPLPHRSHDMVSGQYQDKQWTFQRAANLLRESLELSGDGGVVFLGLGGSPLIEEKAEVFYSAENNKPAPLLALSTHDNPFAFREGSKISDPASDVDSVFLQRLFHRYPKGRLWSFHGDGTLTTSDEEQKSSQSASENSDGGRKSRRATMRAGETSMLNAFFPNASQVIFVPLWDAVASQWHSGCFVWNTEKTNVFSSAVDLSAVLGFASSIMVECNRIDSANADRRKGDFIGNVSHELRSPLHGILAAAEFLGATDPNSFQSSLIETINSCGRTLLDTMNQVLDFSKIMSSDRKRRRLKRDAEDSENLPHLDSLVATDVSKLLEEAVESICRGHSFGKRSTAVIDQTMSISKDSSSFGEVDETLVDRQNDVEVIIDIDDNNWLYKTQPGPLRRIIMNIVGNALKYTAHGHISVRIEVEERSQDIAHHQGHQDQVTLSISDTGKGISNAFLREKLFKPFAQENPLAVGTGLGLSIVRSLVKNMNGKIGVKSNTGEGTTITVSLPLARSVGEEESTSSRTSTIWSPDTVWRDLQTIRQVYRNTRISIWCQGNSYDRLFWSAIRRYIKDWFCMELVPFSPNRPADIVLGYEKDLAVAEREQLPAGLDSLLIFCDDLADYQKSQVTWSALANKVVSVWLPCGPRKLARSIIDILASKTRSVDQGPHSAAHLHATSTTAERTIPRASTSVGSGNSCDEGEVVDLDWQRENPLGSSIVSEDKAPARAKLPVHAAAVRKMEGSFAGPRKPRVLVVEDNEINLKLMLTFLRKRNLQVLDAATNGSIAVDYVEQRSHGYDIIFMDMSMPVMDGFEASRAIRAVERANEVSEPAFIIALTGLSRFADEAKAKAAGVDMFLPKPASFQDVARLLDDWEAKQ